MILKDEYIHGIDAVLKGLLWKDGKLEYKRADTTDTWIALSPTPIWNQDTTGKAATAGTADKLASTLGVSGGGTGATTLTGVVIGNGTNAMTAIKPSTKNTTYWLKAVTTNADSFTTTYSLSTIGKSDVGLGNVDNKSSATIRGEITSSNVTTALGYTPYNSTNPSGYITSSASITGTAAGITGYSFKTLSAVNTSGWTNNTTDDKIIPTMSFIAYWNGAYSGNSSNITKVGTISSGKWQGTAIADTYISSASNWNSAYNWYQLMTTGNTDGVINKWKEVEAFLANYGDSTTLAAELAKLVTIGTALTITGAKTFSLVINGDILGNATTADRLKTVRTISLTGSVTGSGIFDGSGNLSITTTTNHSHSYVNIIGKNGSTITWSINGTALTALDFSTTFAAYNSNGYLPLNGGTLTGAITFANNIYNTVGDDSKIGDINVAGTLGLKGANGLTALAFVNKDNSYYTRLISPVTTSNVDINLPTSAGTLALISQIPQSLPANGGNADTVDNFHASSLFLSLYIWHDRVAFNKCTYKYEISSDGTTWENKDISLIKNLFDHKTSIFDIQTNNYNRITFNPGGYSGISYLILLALYSGDAWGSNEFTIEVGTGTTWTQLSKNNVNCLSSYQIISLDAGSNSYIRITFHKISGTSIPICCLKLLTQRWGDLGGSITDYPYTWDSDGQASVYYATSSGSCTGNAATATTAGALSSEIANDKLPTRLLALHTSGSTLDITDCGWAYVGSQSTYLTNPFLSYHTGNLDYMLWTNGHSTSWASQLATDFRTNNLAVRNKNNGTWNRWAKVLTTENQQFRHSDDIWVEPDTNKYHKITNDQLWNQAVWSVDGYSTGCYVSWKPSLTNCYMMVGLNSDPETNHSYNSIDYCWYTLNGGGLQIFESGSSVNSIAGHTSYSAGDDLRIEYVGNQIKYYHNGILCRTVNRTISGKLYMDSSIYLTGGMYDLSFGPISTSNSIYGQDDAPEHALLHTGIGRGDNASGSTWILIDDCGNYTNNIWGIKANQVDNYIEFYSLSTRRSYINLTNGNFVGNVTGNVSGSSGSCTGNAASASKIYVQQHVGNNVNYPILWTNTAGTTVGNTEAYKSGNNLYFNTSTLKLTATGGFNSGGNSYFSLAEIDSLTSGNLTVQGTSSLGTITSGTWNASVISADYLPIGGTNNGANRYVKKDSNGKLYIDLITYNNNISTPDEAIYVVGSKDIYTSKAGLINNNWIDVATLTSYSGTYAIQIMDTANSLTNCYSGIMILNGSTGRRDEIALHACMATSSDATPPTRLYASTMNGVLALSSQDASATAHSLKIKILKLIAL